MIIKYRPTWLTVEENIIATIKIIFVTLKNGNFSNIATTLLRKPSKKNKELIPKMRQRGLRVITLQGAIEKSPILLSQY